MCGIGGMVDYGDGLLQEDTVQRMLKSLERRGTHQGGVFSSENVQLLHRRLCVVDMENGCQPMQTGEEKPPCTLVYNGELYNTPELRNELEASGVTFHGHLDTEVLLKACQTIFVWDAIGRKNQKMRRHPAVY
jgi:asparagine synthase (glutamine-hydrolysing)